MENMITLTIDNRAVSVPKGTTILDAAASIGINIPALCHMELKGTCVKNAPASCRICVVEVEGRRNLAPSCATLVAEGMVVRTNSARVVRARKTVAELILSDHPNDCLTCPKCNDCELQKLVTRFNIRRMTYKGEQSERKKEETVAITRNMDKCILCRRCETVCREVQTVGVLGAIRRGFDTTIAPTFDRMFKDTDCTYCGQCVAVCPTGALTERDNTDRLLEDLCNPDKIVIAQPAPAVRVALGEEFGLEPGTIVTGKLATSLRYLGFDYVFDTDFGADLTIMEEGAEILHRLKAFLGGDKSVKLPIMTSCCPAWVNFFEHNYPDLLDYPSSAKSPAQMFGAIAKTYWADKMGIPREKLVVVSIMPCLAKKYECEREEFSVDGNPDVDRWTAIPTSITRFRPASSRALSSARTSTSSPFPTPVSTRLWASLPARPQSSARPAASWKPLSVLSMRCTPARPFPVWNSPTCAVSTASRRRQSTLRASRSRSASPTPSATPVSLWTN